MGTSIADQFMRETAADLSSDANLAVLQGVANRVLSSGSVRLNVFSKANIANSFKWRLTDQGVTNQTANDLTAALLLHLSLNGDASSKEMQHFVSPIDEGSQLSSDQLFNRANKLMKEGAFEEAAAAYRNLLRVEPVHPFALNNLGAALSKAGRYQEAEEYFRRAVEQNKHDADASSNLGTLLRWRGYFGQSEMWLRHAVKSNPTHVDARINLGMTLALMGRPREALPHLRKALKWAPRSSEALFALAVADRHEGRFDDSRSMTERALEINPSMPSAWAALAGLQKMTVADGAWLNRAEELAASGTATPIEEAELRFAIGKYCDDVENFPSAFRSYQQANDILKRHSEPYDQPARSRFVDDMIRAYPGRGMPAAGADVSTSTKPIFVIGMMRSGTSLVEQIIASHRRAQGAGELNFWSDFAQVHDTSIRQGSLEAGIVRKSAEDYLRTLEAKSAKADRIVDKAPANSDHVGLIHSAFPHARFIYMGRNPIDTCLSCYFQNFSLGLNFTMDLADLAHYYLEHHRLVAHWRSILPPGTLLDVSYEALIADQEGWTRRILHFLDLEWDDRCLQFHDTQRAVATASYWQVRQKIYKNSVQRWRNYQEFITPLLALKGLHR